MKKLVLSVVLLLAIAAAALAVDFTLPAPLSVGSISVVSTDTANYNLNDDSWIITVVPVISNKLASSTNAVRLTGAKIEVKQITVSVTKQEVYAALGVADFSDTKLIDFQTALMQVAIGKVYTSLAQ